MSIELASNAANLALVPSASEPAIPTGSSGVLRDGGGAAEAAGRSGHHRRDLPGPQRLSVDELSGCDGRGR